MTTRYQESSIPRDFTIRERNPSPQRLVGILVSVFVVTVGVSLMVHNKLLLAPLLIIIFTAFGWYVISQIQFVQDQLLDAEFQNALFSSSLSINNRFLAIIRNDNTIVYFNNGFQDTFPKFLKQSRRGIDILLEQCEVNTPDRDKMLAAIMNGGTNQIIFDIFTDVGPHKIIMSVEPIIKPAGFVLLRGREFIEVRKHAQSTPVLG